MAMMCATTCGHVPRKTSPTGVREYFDTTKALSPKGGVTMPSSAVTISTTPSVSQPAPLSGGQTTTTEKSDIAITQQGGAIVQMPAGTKLADVVKALNALGATPLDLLAILQAMKSAGALNAEIEVI